EERARTAAAAADEITARSGDLGPLHGLPFAFKDTHDVGGWRTTYGSPLFADHVPEADELVVARVRAAGAVTIGKTNVPEFAAGPDPRVPTALGEPGDAFADPQPTELAGLRVAVSADLGGLLEVDHDVRRVVEEAGGALAEAGARVEPAYPDLAEADDTFRTL